MTGHTIPDGSEANASAPALAKRAGVAHADDLAPPFPDDHPVWDEAAHYLAGCCVNLALLASPEKIVIGGGVMNRTCLFGKIRKQVQAKLNGYLAVEQLTTDEGIEKYIVPAVHGDDTGLIGALALSKATYVESGSASSSSKSSGCCDDSSSSNSGGGGCGPKKNGGSAGAFDPTSFILGVAAAALGGVLLSKVK